MLTRQKISKVALRKILSLYDLNKPKKIEPLLTSGNISYLIQADNHQLYFLRLCPSGPRSRSRKEIAAEIELLHYLQTNGFPVIPPIANTNGKEIISRENHHGYLRKFIKAKEKLNPTVKDIKKFGAALGWLHSLIENYQTRNKRRHIFDLVETKKYFKSRKNAILSSRFKNKQEFVSLYEKEIASLKFADICPKGLVHEDLGKRHVLWEKDKIKAIVDFDRSYFGYLILDLGQAIRGWCFINNWQKWSNKNFKALINGYETKRKLTISEKQCLVDAVKFGILERTLSFCLRYIVITKDPGDEKFAWHSLKNLLPIIENNRGIIEKIISK